VTAGVLNKLLPSGAVRRGVPGELCQRCVTSRAPAVALTLSDRNSRSVLESPHCGRPSSTVGYP
jgi:hypothetical protein